MTGGMFGDWVGSWGLKIPGRARNDMERVGPLAVEFWALLGCRVDYVSSQ
jgi:hypothetical protein